MHYHPHGGSVRLVLAVFMEVETKRKPTRKNPKPLCKPQVAVHLQREGAVAGDTVP